jgi:hypothetical protein
LGIFIAWIGRLAEALVRLWAGLLDALPMWMRWDTQDATAQPLLGNTG